MNIPLLLTLFILQSIEAIVLNEYLGTCNMEYHGKYCENFKLQRIGALTLCSFPLLISFCRSGAGVGVLNGLLYRYKC